MKGRGLVSVRSALPCPTITLGPAWERPEDQFNAGRRSDFRRAARKAAAMGDVTYEVHAPDPDTFDRWFDEALDVELHSWKKEAGTAMASDRAKADFFRAFFRAASAAGTFRVAFVRIDGKPPPCSSRSSTPRASGCSRSATTNASASALRARC
jgi:hypothetical protein